MLGAVHLADPHTLAERRGLDVGGKPLCGGGRSAARLSLVPCASWSEGEGLAATCGAEGEEETLGVLHTPRTGASFLQWPHHGA